MTVPPSIRRAPAKPCLVLPIVIQGVLCRSERNLLGESDVKVIGAHPQVTDVAGSKRDSGPRFRGNCPDP